MRKNLGRSTKVDVNKVLRINRKNLILLIVLIWSFLPINDLNDEGGASKGNPPGIGCEKVLENRWNKYSLLSKLKERLSIKKPINVNKWFRWLCNFCKIDESKQPGRRRRGQGRLESTNLNEENPSAGQENFNNGEKALIFIFISCNTILMLIIYSLLLRQNVESNPGPQNNFKIVTYNCNGLGDRSKLRLNQLLRMGGSFSSKKPT